MVNRSIAAKAVAKPEKFSRKHSGVLRDLLATEKFRVNSGARTLGTTDTRSTIIFARYRFDRYNNVAIVLIYARLMNTFYSGGGLCLSECPCVCVCVCVRVCFVFCFGDT